MEGILGYLVAMTLSLLGVTGFVPWAKMGVQNVQTAATASQMVAFNKAAQQYVQDNSAAILAAATATTPWTLPSSPTPTQTLINAGYLPVGFSPTNPYGQQWQLQVLKPAANQLQALVTSQGGSAIPVSNSAQLVQIAAQAGAQGGYVPWPNQAGSGMVATNAYGASGAWNVPLTSFTNPGSGHLASLLAFSGSQANNNYLYRVAVAGQPQLNTMQTDLSMGNNNITAANNITATNTITAKNANLGAGNALNIGGGANVYGDSSNIALRPQGAVYFQNPTGSAPADLAEVGNISATGTVNANNSNIWNNLNVNNTVTATTMNFNTTAANCSWNTVTMRANNQMWVCNQWGNWIPISQLLTSNTGIVNKFMGYADGWGVGKPTCGPGGTPTASIIPQTTGANVAANPPWESTIYRLIDKGTWWYVQITMLDPYGNGYTGNNMGLTAEVDTQCTYNNI